MPSNLNNRLSCYILFTFLYTSHLFGQATIKMGTGDIEKLKNIKSINLVFDYSTLAVGLFKTEAEYLEKKKSDMNGDEKKYANFLDYWWRPRITRYEPTFERVLNKYITKLGISAQQNLKKADVDLKVITTFIEPGFGGSGLIKRDGIMNVKLIFTDSSGNEVIRYFVEDAPVSPTSAFDPSLPSRIDHAYAVAAKLLGKELKKQLKK